MMTREIASLERLRNTRDGNPSWRVNFVDGTSARTRRDSAVAFVIDGSDYQGVPVAVGFDPAGEIVSVDTVCGFTWRTSRGRDATCERPAHSHGVRHVDGDSWVAVGSERDFAPSA